MNDKELQELHKKSDNNRKELLASEIAGCFYCLSTFNPLTIKEWIDDNQTALCPNCGIDSVIANPVFSKLREMEKHFFGRFNSSY